MQEIQDDLKIYSEEVRDVLSSPPKTIFKWGNTILLGFIILIFMISWIIKYPDIITSQILITTQIPPEKLIAKTSGRIEAILIEDKTLVKPNTPLAVIENSANFNDVFLLKSIVDTFSLNLNAFPFEKFQEVQLGEIENSFALFQKECIASELNKNLQPFKVESLAQNFESRQLLERLEILEAQKSINELELGLTQKDIERYEKLFAKGIIAAQEMERQKLALLQAEKNYKSLLSSISQLKSTINELNRNSKTTVINENTTTINLERNTIQSFFQLKKAIREWELRYVFYPSIEGTVSFLQIWSENQTINANENLFAIIPVVENGFIGKVKASSQNSGKLKIGQNVNIRLANYPDREFGLLKGSVKTIALTPDADGNILIDVSLPNNLQTSYQKQIDFQQEMSGTADIITEDLRLLERLLYQFRDIFRR